MDLSHCPYFVTDPADLDIALETALMEFTCPRDAATWARSFSPHFLVIRTRDLAQLIHWSHIDAHCQWRYTDGTIGI